MAYLNMQRLPENGRRFISLTVTAGTTSSDIVLEHEHQVTSVCVYPVSGGTALVEISTSPPSDVKGGTANWIDWAKGSVTVDTNDSTLSPITGVRATATTQDCILEVVA